ncbi:glycosyltransferase family 2 protein [Gillisia limnaea]|uniref:Glycosyl transferase family 2 n=1 Tax=Gillisia limnaea (strain DSM 15749 / LMG 21470 / R-8282) TaxID=865937 RepID=H2BV67_GILLR|nr:glycosyltransferase [Gillisia limnaea]EHQ01732.1 glycosyl transferase family 2 [Gillisia limnaea DSM 15749]
MKFNLIICTYKRPGAIGILLKSVFSQTRLPDEVLVVDASPDDETRNLVEKQYPVLKYFKVGNKDRGLTRQRNFGIENTSGNIEVVCFLDDDIVLTPEYFKNLISTYSQNPNALGVGGAIIDEVAWKDNTAGNKIQFDEFEMDGCIRKLGIRNVLRKKLGLLSDQPPGYMPEFSNGLSTGFLPPSRQTYPVEFFMGGVSSYRKELFKEISFSLYFEGYGLYEDMDFCLRASKIGPLYVNTAAQLYHHHEEAGRPNQFNYGKMVVRNGWYVWRVKYPNPNIKAQLKWHSIAFLLTLVRLGNVFTTKNKKESLTEGLGRIVGWISLYINSPKLEK